MALVGQASADTANTLFQGYADKLFSEAGKSGVYESFVEVIPTQSEVNEIDILEAMPVVRAWYGEKRYDDVRVSTFSASMRSYEKSFEIQRRKLVGMSVPDLEGRIKSWLGNFTALYDNLAIAALVANPTGYDGVALASASHPRGPAGATQSNVTTSAFSVANHKAIVRAMQELRDANGEPFEISPNLMVCGPKTLPDVLEVTKSTTRLQAVDAAAAESGTRVTSSAIPNVYSGTELYGGGTMQVLCSKRFVGTYDDYVLYLDTTKSAKPLICFEKRKPEIVAQTDMTSEARFNQDRYRWSLEADLVFAPAAWQPMHLILV